MASRPATKSSWSRRCGSSSRVTASGSSSGTAGGSGRSAACQLRLGLGIEVQLLYAKCAVGGGERPVGEHAAQQKVSFVGDGVGLDEAMGELRGEREVAVFFGGEGEEAGGGGVVGIDGQRLAEGFGIGEIAGGHPGDQGRGGIRRRIRVGRSSGAGMARGA